MSSNSPEWVDPNAAMLYNFIMDSRKTIENIVTDRERALYNTVCADITGCTFAGEADGESALKECRDIRVRGCAFSLRYPLWHVKDFTAEDCVMDVNARAAVWYSERGRFSRCKLGGIKVFRECADIAAEDCEISSFESGWHCRGITLTNCRVLSEYLLLGSSDIRIAGCALDGKYPMQYVNNAVIENSAINFKDALWHAKDVTVKNCELKGEYLGWYSENLTLENCLIEGTQPLCYCKGLKLINCRMKDCDLAFELSEVEADIAGEILSVRSPLSGTIVCDGVGEIVRDVTGYECNGKIVVRGK